MNSLRNIFTFLILFLFFNVFAQTGSLDTSFDPGTGTKLNKTASPGSLYGFAFDGDKVIAVGNFDRYNDYNTELIGIVKINKDGTRDASFSAIVDDWVSDIVKTENGKFLISGVFTNVNGVSCPRIARINSDGTFDNSFSSLYATNAKAVKDIELQADGKIILVGTFTKYDGQSCNGVVRINSDGTLDNIFSVGTGMAAASGKLLTMEVARYLSSGKILIGGTFSSFNGINKAGIIRLNSDGSVDDTFNKDGNGAERCSFCFEGGVFDIIVQEDGKIIIGGDFDLYNGNVSAKKLIRLTENGALDKIVPSNGRVLSLIKLTDGKILVAGDFNSLQTQDASKIALLNEDLSFSDWFDPGTGFDATVNKIVQDDDGNIFAGGFFKKYNGTDRFGIAKITYTSKTTPDFGISSNIDRITVVEGERESATLTITPFNGFTGDVSISAEFGTTPEGGSLSLSENSVEVSGETSISLTLITTDNSSSSNKSGRINISASGGGITKELIVYFTINPSTTPYFTISSDPTSLSVGQNSSGLSQISVIPYNSFKENVNLSVSNIPSGVTYSFSNAEVTNGSGASNLSINVSTAAVPGNYMLVVNGTSGYSGDANQNIALTITGTATSVTNLNEVGVKIYPNPVSNVLTIQSIETLQSLVLVDLMGKIVKQLQVNKNEFIMNLSGLEKGIYLLELQGQNREVGMYKIIKE